MLNDTKPAAASRVTNPTRQAASKVLTGTIPHFPKGSINGSSRDRHYGLPFDHAYWLDEHLGRSLVVKLVNGTQLVGELLAFDQSAIELGGECGPRLIFKHAISHLRPERVRGGADR
ncbi:MAG: hypothetical protein GEU28_13150 [Dehalococcoidia bacterium]|nr:hypothetical protein [Dehalococcoidia bacterium]